MTDSQIRALMTDLDALFLTGWAEARGDGREGNSSVEERIAVMCVCRNRLRRSGLSYKGVCFAPLQFSCWNEGKDANHLALMELAERVVTQQMLKDPVALETRFLARGVVDGLILDRTGGATHYYAPAGMVPVGRVPGWAKDQTPLAEIGRQKFFLVA